MWMSPPALYANTPKSQPIIKITAIIYNRFLMALHLKMFWDMICIMISKNDVPIKSKGILLKKRGEFRKFFVEV
jgi:hypothetical protein